MEKLDWETILDIYVNRVKNCKNTLDISQSYKEIEETKIYLELTLNHIDSIIYLLRKTHELNC